MGTARLFILELGCGVSDIHGGSLDGQPWPRDGSEKTTVLRINPQKRWAISKKRVRATRAVN